MNKRLVSVLVFALVVSAAASLVVYRLIMSQMTSSAKVSGAKVVVATHNLQNGALIKDIDVKIADWGGPVPTGAFTKTEDVVGRGVIEPIYDGEPLLESRVAQKGAGAGMAATIPSGMRAVAVRVNDVVGVAGFVTPGMRVDILIAGNPPGPGAQAVGTQTKTLLQNVEVLSAGQNIQKDAEGKPVSVPVVNLLVTPDDAEILSLASNETRIQLVLRNPTDKETVTTRGTAVAYLFNGRDMKPPAPAKTRPVAAPRPAPLPPQAAPAPERVNITVEVIHGSKKSETKFQEDKEKDPKNEGKQR
ncbi:MAG TPA: Flp pilus assembly protein CpaB [Bryobacteraceae bacterium]|nr:Flp pilus assembly protein CpaB [Bryobacteraceae bacterium]